MSAVRVAIVDSGINAHHSHVGSVADGISILLDPNGELVRFDDYRDRLGHGTAVAGAVRLYAPEAELLAINVFDGSGRAAAMQLVAAIEWALEHGSQIINLSLGTANPDDAPLLVDVCRRAREAGVLLVASAPSNGTTMWPSCLPDVIGVKADDTLAPDQIGFVPGVDAPWRANGHPRPLPSPAQGRNFKGSSFAAARVTGQLAGEAARMGRWDAGGLLAWLRGAAVLPVSGQ